jgi:hypothetical protein
MYFIDSKTFPKEGTSYAFIRHNKRIYEGKARLHPDDAFSEFTGCRYAETRAKIKALRAEYRKKKASCEECRKFVRAVTQYNQFNAKDPSAKAMFRQLNRRIKEVNDLANEITRLEFSLRIAMRQQDKLNRMNKND